VAADTLQLMLHLAGFVAAGALMGFAAGLIRSGGGILAAPLVLYALEGTSEGLVRAAVGTALAATLLLSLRAAHYHATHGNLEARLVLPWALAAATGGALGGLGAAVLPEPVLLAVLAAALVVAGLLLPLRGAVRPLPGQGGWASLPLGVVLGALSAASGAGGGSFIGSAWRWLGLPQAAGHAAVCGVALALPGLVPLLLLVPSALPLSVGAVSLPGALLVAGAAALAAPHGVRLGTDGPQRLLAFALAFVMLSMGFALLRTAVTGA
jgi:uncharacterized membrane protein YfcA